MSRFEQKLCCSAPLWPHPNAAQHLFMYWSGKLCYCSHPFMYFPVFYTVKSLVERQPHPLEHAYNKWRNEIWDSCKALWCLWVPGQIINFAFVPRYLRVPFGKTSSPPWCCNHTLSAVKLHSTPLAHPQPDSFITIVSIKKVSGISLGTCRADLVPRSWLVFSSHTVCAKTSTMAVLQDWRSGTEITSIGMVAHAPR